MGLGMGFIMGLALVFVSFRGVINSGRIERIAALSTNTKLIANNLVSATSVMQVMFVRIHNGGGDMHALKPLFVSEIMGTGSSKTAMPEVMAAWDGYEIDDAYLRMCQQIKSNKRKIAVVDVESMEEGILKRRFQGLDYHHAIIIELFETKANYYHAIICGKDQAMFSPEQYAKCEAAAMELRKIYQRAGMAEVIK